VLEAFLWGLLAASSLVFGGLLVFVHQPAPRTLGLVMGFGAGVLISALAFELVQEAVEVSGGEGGTAVGFFAGAVAFTGGDAAISRFGYSDRKDIDAGASGASALAIVLGIVLDGVPESAVVGLTLLTTGEIGISVLVAVFISNLPEAVAASGSLLSGGWSRQRVLGLWTGIALVCAVASAAGYVLLEDASGGAIAAVQGFAGGAILTMLATTMMPEAYEHAGRPTGLATALGFAVAFGINWLST
jgi:ZIP family zinc transporter